MANWQSQAIPATPEPRKPVWADKAVPLNTEENISAEYVSNRAKAAYDLAVERKIPLEDASKFESYDPGLYKKMLFAVEDKTQEFLGFDIFGSMSQRVSELGTHARKLRNVALYNVGAAAGGYSWGLADILANKAFDDENLAATVARLIDFEPNETDYQAAGASRFLGGLYSVGGPVRKLVSKLPIAKYLQNILSSGLTFGTVEATNQFSQNIATGKPVDWSEIHHQSAIGTLFGAGEVAVAATMTGVMKGMNEAYKAAMRAKYGPIAEVHQVAADAKYTAEYYRKFRRMPEDMVKKYGPSIPKVKPAEGVTVNGVPVESGKLPGQEDIVRGRLFGRREARPIYWREEPVVTREPAPLGMRIAEESQSTVMQRIAETSEYNARVAQARTALKQHPIYVDMLASYNAIISQLNLPEKIDFGQLRTEALAATEGNKKLRAVVGEPGQGKPFDLLREDMADGLAENSIDLPYLSDPAVFFDYFEGYYTGGLNQEKFNRWALEQASKNTEFMIELARFQMAKDGLDPVEIEQQISLMEKQIYGEPTNNIEAQVSSDSQGFESYETETGIDPTDQEADAIISGFIDDLRRDTGIANLGESPKVVETSEKIIESPKIENISVSEELDTLSEASAVIEESKTLSIEEKLAGKLFIGDIETEIVKEVNEKFPEPILGQKSLTEVGNKIAEFLGYNEEITWTWLEEGPARVLGSANTKTKEIKIYGHQKEHTVRKNLIDTLVHEIGHFVIRPNKNLSTLPGKNWSIVNIGGDRWLVKKQLGFGSTVGFEVTAKTKEQAIKKYYEEYGTRGKRRRVHTPAFKRWVEDGVKKLYEEKVTRVPKGKYDIDQKTVINLSDVRDSILASREPDVAIKPGQKNAGFVDISGAADAVKNSGQALLDYSRDTFNWMRDRVNEMRFYPGTPIEFQNAVRVNLIGASVRASNKIVGEIAPVLLNGLTEREIENGVSLAYARDLLERTQANKGNPDISLRDIQNEVFTLEAAANPKALKLADSINTVQQAYTKSAIDRGLIDPAGTQEYYLRHFVQDYTPEWAFYRVVPPSKLRTPFRGYTKSAVGTKKEHYKTMESILFSWYEMEIDNIISDFIQTQASKYDLMNSLSKADKAKLFGLNQNLKVNQLVPGRIYEWNGEQYRGWCPDAPFNRNFFKNEDGEIVMGKYKKTYLLPMNIRDAFENMTTRGGPYISKINAATRLWKSMAIMSHYTSYNLNNLIGDTWMAMSQHPKPMNLVRSYLPAINYLLGRWDSNPALYQEFNKFIIDNDILKGASSISEIASFKSSADVMSKIMSKMQAFSEFREGINRAAYAWSLFLEMKAGSGLDAVGAHPWIKTDGLSVNEALGKISRDVEVDYKWNSRMWSRYVSGMAAPFGTWYAKASANTWKWYLRNLGKGTAIFMALPVASTLFNNRSDESREIESKLPDSVRNGVHFNLGINESGTYNILRLQTPQDAMIGFKIFTIATSYANRVANGEMDVDEAVTLTLKEWGKKEAKSLLLLSAPLARFLMGMSNTNKTDPMDNTPIYRRDPKDMTWEEKRNDVAAYATRCLLPMLSYQIMAFEKGLPQSSATKDFISTIAGKRALGIYEINPKTELVFELDSGQKVSLSWNDNAKIEWIYQKTSSILGDFETDYVNSGKAPDEFFKTPDAKKSLVRIYDLWSQFMDGEEKVTDDQKVEFVADKLQGQILNRFASSGSLDRWYKIALLNAKTDQEKKDLSSKYKMLSEYKLTEAIKTQPSAARDLWLGKKLKGTDVPIDLIWQMP